MSISTRLLLRQYRTMKSLAGVGAARNRMSTKVSYLRKKIAAARKTIQVD